MTAVLLFAVFASVDLFFFVREDKYMIQTLFDGCDTSRIFAADDIADLLWQCELLLGDNLTVFDDIDCDIVIDESKDVKIHKIDRTLDLHDIFFAHFAALGIFNDGYTAVQFVKVEILVNLHALAGLDVIQHESLGDTTYS